MKRFVWVMVLLMAALLPWGAVKAQGAQWTIIYYMPGDTDLEQFMIGDLMEMQIVGSTDQVNIVMEMDRVPGYDDTNGSWEDTRRFFIKQGDPSSLSYGDFEIDPEGFIATLEQTDPADYGLTQEELDAEIDALRGMPAEELEMMALGMNSAPVVNADPQLLQQESLEQIGETESSPEYLSDFIIWAVENYPAEHYMIMMSDHGGGWHGIAYDETSGGDPFSMQELAEALKMATEATGIEKFDVLGFDACLMGQLEVYNVIAPYVRYTFAAQEPIPGAGWEYVTPLTLLAENPSVSIEDYGKSVIDSFVNYYTNDMPGYDKFDLHLIDLEKVSAVNDALNSFIELVAQNPDAHIESIGYALQQSYTAADGDPSYASVDLQDFMTNLQRFNDDADIQAAAQSVIEAVEGAEIYGSHSEGINANGVAIYFPANADDYSLGDANRVYPEQVGDVMGSWISFLDLFHGTASEIYAPEKTGLSIDITQVVPADATADIYNPPVIIFETDGTGIVDMQFYAALELEEGFSIIVDASALELSEVNEDGELIAPFPEGPSTTEFQWNIEAPLAIDSEGNSQFLAFISSPDDPNRVSVKGIYRPLNGKQSEAQAFFDLETRQLVSVFGIQESSFGSAIGEIKIRRGDTFEPYFLILNESGEIEYVPSETQLLMTDEPLTFQYVPAPDGNYQLTIWLEDIAGNNVQDTATFTIASGELDTNWRGFKDITSGLRFLYPWGWSDATTVVGEDDSYRYDVSNMDGTQFVYVTVFDEAFGVTSIDDLVNNALAYVEDIGGTAGEPEATAAGFAGEYEAVVVPYSYQNDEGEDHLGWLILSYSEENALGYQIDVDVVAADEEFGSQLVSFILGSLSFEAPIIYGEGE